LVAGLDVKREKIQHTRGKEATGKSFPGQLNTEKTTNVSAKLTEKQKSPREKPGTMKTLGVVWRGKDRSQWLEHRKVSSQAANW